MAVAAAIMYEDSTYVDSNFEFCHTEEFVASEPKFVRAENRTVNGEGRGRGS